MFAYIDETGHSGRNIFDKNENFRLGTLLTVEDVSDAIGTVFNPFLENKGIERLHANEWPEHDLVDLTHALIETLAAGGPWQFNVFSIHKPYIAPTKFVDLIFDPGENEAVPNYWYWDEMHRHVLCLVVDSAMERPLGEAFWRAFLKDDVEAIIEIATMIEQSVKASTEPMGIKKVFQAAIGWAKKHPEQFTLIATEKRKGYQGHSPNIIAFTQAFQAVHEFCKAYSCQPEVLVHDQQEEFRTELRRHYETFGQMVHEDRGDGRFLQADFAPYPNGQFTLMPSGQNLGLQAVDLLLWISQRTKPSDEMKKLKARIAENLSDFYISRGMSQLIVDMHLFKNHLG
jgi:hypothetical protein